MMKNSELLDKFFEIEKKYKLFESITSDGIHWWDIIRYHAYIQILYQTVRTSAKEPNTVKKNKKLNIFNMIFQDIKYLYNNRNATAFCYTYPRVIDDSGFSIDLVSKDYLSILNSQSFVVDGLHSGHTREITFNNIPLLVFRRIFKLINKKRNIDINIDINSILNKEFNCNLDFKNKIDILLINYRAERLYYKKLLSFIKPKHIFFVASGGEKGLVASAKNLGIKTAELQHGQINRYHLYYSYPENVPYNTVTVPDTFLTFAEHWNTTNYPVKNKISIGNSLFNKLNTNHFSKYDDRILVISHENYAPDLLPLVQSLAKKKDELSIIFKLHPQQNKSELIKVQQFFLDTPNVEVIHTEKTTTELMSEVSAVIAIQSTCIYEALQSGVKVFLYARQDFQSHDDVFNNINVHIVDTVEDIIDSSREPFMDTEKFKFFMPFDKVKFIDFVKSSYIDINNY